MQNIQQWSTNSYTPNRSLDRKQQKRSTRPHTPATTTQTPYSYAPPNRTPHVAPPHAVQPPSHPQKPRAPLPSAPQALQSSYASRMRTGATLLMQPILAPSFATATAGPSTANTRSRRGGAINYADPGSGDEFEEPPDAGAGVDSDDSDFVASGGVRASVRSMRPQRGGALLNFTSSSSFQPQRLNAAPVQEKTELDQSYLGMIPPSRHISARRIGIGHTQHSYPYVSPSTLLLVICSIVQVRFGP